MLCQNRRQRLRIGLDLKILRQPIVFKVAFYRRPFAVPTRPVAHWPAPWAGRYLVHSSFPDFLINPGPTLDENAVELPNQT